MYVVQKTDTKYSRFYQSKKDGLPIFGGDLTYFDKKTCQIISDRYNKMGYHLVVKKIILETV